MPGLAPGLTARTGIAPTITKGTDLSTWTLFNPSEPLVITTGQADPWGGTTATRLRQNATVNGIYGLYSTCNASATQWYLRIAHKAYSDAALWVLDASDGNPARYVNPANGAVTGGIGTGLSGWSDDLGGGWWLTTFSGQYDTSGALPIVVGNTSTYSLVGNTGRYIDIALVQLLPVD